MQLILTERLQLRPPCKQDAAPLLAIRNSPFVLRYNAMRPLTLPQMEQQLSELHDSMLVLSCKDSGLVIGAVFFLPTGCAIRPVRSAFPTIWASPGASRAI